MVLASKVAWVGIVFMLLTTGPHPTPLASGANLSKEVPAVAHRNDVKTMQETLRNKGHYRRPGGREESGYETAKSKPSAYIEWAKGSRRTSKTLRKAVKTVAAPESGWEDREKTLQAENDNPPQ
jgi:hypothetical protein